MGEFEDEREECPDGPKVRPRSSAAWPWPGRSDAWENMELHLLRLTLAGWGPAHWSLHTEHSYRCHIQWTVRRRNPGQSNLLPSLALSGHFY